MNRALGADNAPLPRPVDSGGRCRRPDDSRSPSPSRPRGDAGECLIPARLVPHLSAATSVDEAIEVLAESAIDRGADRRGWCAGRNPLRERHRSRPRIGPARVTVRVEASSSRACSPASTNPKRRMRGRTDAPATLEADGVTHRSWIRAASVKPLNGARHHERRTLAQPAIPPTRFARVEGDRRPCTRDHRPPAAVFIVRQTDLGSGTTLQGSGIAVRQVRTVAPFTAVDLAGSNNVIIHVGRPQSVVVRADDNLIRHVTTRVDSGTLVIGSTGSYASKAAMSVTISVPALEALRLSGSGNVAAEDIHATRFTVSLSGSGNVHGAAAQRTSRRCSMAPARRGCSASWPVTCVPSSEAPASFSSPPRTGSTHRCRAAGRSSTQAILLT